MPATPLFARGSSLHVCCVARNPPGPEALEVPFEPADWQAHGQLLFHAPTRAALVVLAPSHIKSGDRVSIFDIFARLVHVCDEPPVPTEITKLGRAAIIICLMEIGQLEGWKIRALKDAIRTVEGRN